MDISYAPPQLIMPSTKRKFGDVGERIAEKYLIDKGHKIIARNYLKPWGEVDIVAKKGTLLVFCEVKTRDSEHTEHFLPEQNVDRKKSRKLQRICATYLAEQKCDPDQEWQIDIIAITIDRFAKKARVRHISNAIWKEHY